MPTPDRELRKLEAAATKGEWFADGGAVFIVDEVMGSGPDEGPEPQPCLLAQTNPADAAFIAHFRNAAPALLAKWEECERLREENAQLRLPYDHRDDEDEQWERALDCAARQFEGYARRSELETPEQRRAALSDALQHAVGLLRLDRMNLKSRLAAAEAVVSAARKYGDPVVDVVLAAHELDAAMTAYDSALSTYEGKSE